MPAPSDAIAMATRHRERWQEISPLLDELLAMDIGERSARIDQLRTDDAALADAVAALLRHTVAIDRDGFLSGAPVDLPGRELVGATIGAYTLVRVIGHGGMGTVWLATRSDGHFEGRAAVKLLNLALIGRGGAERFAREGRILARLDHPNIARLLDAGVTATGQPYLVLEYVQGEPIDAYCDAHRLDTAARIALFTAVLQAVSHAHRNLVLHRDLKPSNILVTAEGRIKLLDFGIAKLLDDGDLAGGPTELTQMAGRAFTPDCAAPEQVQGQPVTTATDVYALGVLLYMLLAGEHPTIRDSDAGVERLRAVIERDPPRLSTVAQRTALDKAERRGGSREKLAHELRGDLERIAAKALKKEPAERYATVDALADDLQRFTRHEPVRARRDTLAYRAAKFVRRHRVPALLGTIAFVALCAGLVGTLTEARRAVDQRDFALRQLYRTEAVTDLSNFLIGDVTPSGRSLSVGDLIERAEEIVTHQEGTPDDTQIELLVSVGLQYKLLDRDDKARQLLERAYAASRAVAEPSLRAHAACSLAFAIAAGGENARAEALVREALAQLPDDPRYILGRFGCLMRGTEAANLAGNAQLALERAQAAYRLVEALPFPSKVFEMRALMNLGEAHRANGRDAEAISTFEQAYVRLNELGRQHTETASTLYNNWALALQLAGRPVEAEALFRRAMENSSADARGADVSPMLLNNFARVLDDLGREDDAALRSEQALQGARRSGDETVVNQALLVVAAIRRHRGDPAGAARALDEVEPRLRHMLPAGHLAFAALASQRALLARAEHDLASALHYADDAVKLVDTGKGESSFLPTALRRRALVELSAEHAANARADAQRAVNLQRQRLRSGERSSELGLSLLVLAQSLRASGDSDGARATLISALDQLRPTLGAAHLRVQQVEAQLAALSGPSRAASAH